LRRFPRRLPRCACLRRRASRRDNREDEESFLSLSQLTRVQPALGTKSPSFEAARLSKHAACGPKLEDRECAADCRREPRCLKQSTYIRCPNPPPVISQPANDARRRRGQRIGCTAQVPVPVPLVMASWDRSRAARHGIAACVFHRPPPVACQTWLPEVTSPTGCVVKTNFERSPGDVEGAAGY